MLADGCRALDEALEVCAGRAEVLALCIANEVPADIVRVHGDHAVSDVLSGSWRGHIRRIASSSSPTGTSRRRSTSRSEGLRRAVVQRATSSSASSLTALPRAAADPWPASGRCCIGRARPRQLGDARHRRAGSLTLDWQLREAFDEAGLRRRASVVRVDRRVVRRRRATRSTDWGFGLTTARSASRSRRWRRSARPGRSSYRAAPDDDRWPRVSVVVCAYNEERHPARRALSSPGPRATTQTSR